MSRKKPKRWSIRFELAPEDGSDVRLHEHLNKLAEEGEASEWIRATLLAAIVERPEELLLSPKVKPNGASSERAFSPVPKPSQANKRPVIRYEKVDE